MTRIPVQSSNLVSVGYDPDTRTLEIEFKGGRVYQYFEVPRFVYDDLTGGIFSPGKYFRTAVQKGGYKYKEIKDGDPDPIAA